MDTLWPTAVVSKLFLGVQESNEGSEAEAARCRIGTILEDLCTSVYKKIFKNSTSAMSRHCAES